MSPSETIKEYTKSICEQVRWKKAHGVITQELENHITDQKDAFMAKGLDENEATGKAVEQMGDPITVGSQFDRTYRPRTAWSMIGLTVLALAIGVGIQFLIQGSSPRPDIPDLYYFKRIIFTTIIGMMGMLIAYFLDFTIIGKYPKGIFITFSMILLLYIPFGYEINGARTFLAFPYVIYAIPLSGYLSMLSVAYAGIIYCMRSKGYVGILLCGIFYAVPTLIALTVCGTLSGIFLYTLICWILLIFSITKGWFSVRKLHGILLVVLPTIAVLAAIVYNSQYIMSRLGAMWSSWIFPWTGNNHAGYISVVIRTMLEGAKFWGEGALPSQVDEAERWLPSINGEYLVTYLIHRFGWVSFIIITAVLAAFVLRGFYLCAKQKSVLGRLVATAILLTLSVQIIVYLITNLGFEFYAQSTLPLISYGGSATVINLILIGIMLSVFRTGEIADEPSGSMASGNSENKLFAIEDGKLIIDLSLAKKHFRKVPIVFDSTDK